MATERPLLSFTLVAPDGVIFEDEVAEVIVPTPNGAVAVLPQHMPLATAVATGVLAVRRRPGDEAEQLDHYAIEDGMLTVTPGGGARLAAEAAEHGATIDALEAERKVAEARAALEQHIEADQIVVTQRVVARNMARLEASRLHGQRHRRQHAPRPTLEQR